MDGQVTGIARRRRGWDTAVLVHGGHRIGGADLLRSAGRLAGVLRSRGVGPGVPVQWAAGPGPAAVVGRLAAHLLGARPTRDAVVRVDNALLAEADRSPGASEPTDVEPDGPLAEWVGLLDDGRPIRHAVLLPAEGTAADAAVATLLLGGTVLLGDPGTPPARVLAALEQDEATHLTLPSALLWAVVDDPTAALTDLSALRRVVHVGEDRPTEARRAQALLGPVLVHRPDVDGPDTGSVVGHAHQAGVAAIPGVTAEAVAEFASLLDAAVLASMIAALQSADVLVGETTAHHTDDVLAAARVADAHRGVVRRWLRVLRERGVVGGDGEVFHGTARVTADEVSAAWRRVRQTTSGPLGGAAFIDYLEAHVEVLPALMRGEQQAALLLFPEGRTELADAVYRDTVTARYLNTAVASVVRGLAAERTADRPLRVLEVGAGTGATTEAVIAALGPEPAVDYLFTDVSAFFLDTARTRFAGHPWVRFGLLDVDRPPARQGVAPGSVDVIVAAGVLNNARDTDATVRALAETVVPGGWLLVTEPTREHLEILFSQAFMMTEAQDARLESDATFLSRAQWHDVLGRAGLSRVATMPGEEQALAPLGQRLFVARR